MKMILARLLSAGVIAALALGLLSAGIPTARAAGTVDLTTLGAAYTQDFNTLAITGTTNTDLPAGWELRETGSSSSNNGAYQAGTGSYNGGDTYSFGLAGDSERAFGGLLSGTLNPTIGAQFANSTGGNITSLEVSYTGEQWRYGVTGRPADRIDFQYSLDATSLADGTWIDVDALDFNSPVTSGSAGALNGNLDPNRTALSATIEGLSLAPGAIFWIRWTDYNVTNSDDGLAVDDFSLTPQGDIPSEDTAPSVTTSYPADGSTVFPVDANLTVTFSEPVDLTGDWFELSCATSGLVTAAVSGGPTTYTLDPDATLVVGESCTLTVFAAGVTDQDSNDPPDNLEVDFTVGFSTYDVCAQPYTAIPAIQGSGLNVAITGSVTTMGVVVGDFEGASPALRGFFLQDMSGDGDPATSDGIFVFGGNTQRVSLGDVVRVTGTASDYQGQTQISLSSYESCGYTASVEPVDIDFPVPDSTYLERFEGMLVRVPETMYVTEHFQLGRFGQVVLSSDGRLQQPTSITTPGPAALALQAANNLRKIILDDTNNDQNVDPILFGRGGMPLSAENTLRGGDTITGLVGVLNYTWAGNSASGNAYRIRPVSAAAGGYNFEPANSRPTDAPVVGGSVTVVGMNTLNFFNTFGDGNCTKGVGGEVDDCRGASNDFEFERQWVKTVAAILAMDPDVLGINEIENDGYAADSAIAFLVDKLNEATAPGTYAFVDVDTLTGQVNAMGTDAIKVGLIYKPGVVALVGQTAPLNSEAFVNGGDSAPRSRPALVQAFEELATGARFVVAVNHLKSKGSACNAPDAGDGQGNCNDVRTAAAAELAAFLASDPTGTGDPDSLIIGDLNSYAKEDPITTLLNAGFTNLIESFLGPDAYSYVFDGQWGYLDHALASPSLVAQVTGVGDFHINADEPSVLDYLIDYKSDGQIVSLYAPDMYRVSDHDPVMIGLNLNAAPVLGPVTAAAGQVLVNTPASVSAPFSDPNPLDTHTALIDWGDGSQTAGVISEANGAGTVSGEHAYAAAGFYTVTITVTDQLGLVSNPSVYESLTVYDPAAGTASGGGWFYTGKNKVSISLSVYYPAGASQPRGNVRLQSNPLGLKFHSLPSLDWMVITGDQAVIRGQGTNNGLMAPNGTYYQFILYVEDASPDTVRMVIWWDEIVDGATVQHVIFDNGAMQSLGYGSILVD